MIAQTFLLDHTCQLIRLQVLYDETMSISLGIGRRTLGIPGKGNATFADINGWPLQIPLTKLPFRRALFWKSYFHYQEALHSGRSHLCAVISNPGSSGWDAIRNACMSSSECAGSIFFLHFTFDVSSEDDAKESAV